MAYLIGVVLAVVVGGIASLLVIASDYGLFAVMGDLDGALPLEVTVFTGFLAVSGVGFRRSLWIVVAGLGAHGVFDALHDQVITNPGVPAWWPRFCLSYDVVAAGYLASLLLRRVVPAYALQGASDDQGGSAER